MQQIVKEGRPIAITAYILIVGVVIAMSMNADTKNPFASFHIRQALGLSVTFISLGLIIRPLNDPRILFAMWIPIVICWIFGLFTAIRGTTSPLPLLGNLFQKFFKSVS